MAVFYGLKPVFRTFAIALDKFAGLKKILGGCGLFAGRSDFRISSADGITLSPKGKSVYVYISRPEKLAEEAKRIEEAFHGRNGGSYRTMLRFSRLMGYPKCCFDFYERFNRQPSGDRCRSHQIEYAARRNTRGGFSFYLNNLSRWDGYLVPHFPCSYNCRPSIEYAKKVLLAISDLDPELALKYAALLKFPVMKFLGHGWYVRYIGGKAGSGGTVVYRASSGENEVSNKFSRGNKVIVGKKKIKIFKDNPLVGAYDKKSELDGVVFDFK